MHILLITYAQVATNPRLVKEADALSAAGHHVEVITGDYLVPWRDSANDAYGQRPWQIVERIAYGPMANLPQRLRQTIGHRLCRHLWHAGFKDQQLETRAWHPVASSLIRAAQRHPADLYIAHYPAALPAAALAARRHGGLYAFDAEDFHLGDPPEDSTYDAQRALTRAIESRWLPGAAFVTAASPGIADAYAAAYAIPTPTVVRNMFSLCQAPAGPTPAGTCPESPSIYWFSQTIGPDRGLECAIQAIRLSAARPHLHLRGQISEHYRHILLDLVRQLGVEQHLHFHPPASPTQLETLAAQFDVGLVGETGITPNRRIALVNKLFSYALAGIPALLSDIPAHQAIAAEAGNAVSLYRANDPQSLADAIDRWLIDPGEQLEKARATSYRLGQTLWNWEAEQTALLRRVEIAGLRRHSSFP
jgi:glycosyltransferase involved in cell wall biosynthesis